MESEEAVHEHKEAAAESVDLSPGLRAIRRRRWCLWVVIIVYVPLIKIALSYQGVVGKVFAVWFVFMFAAVLWSSLAKCPRCGNYFHIQGFTLLYLRKCLHCQLHVNADKNGGD